MISRPFEEVIHELCTQVLSGPDPETLPKRIIDHVLETFQVEWATLWVTEQKGHTGEKQLRLKAAAGPAEKLMQVEEGGLPAVYDFGQGLTGEIAAEQRTVNIGSWQDFESYTHAKKYDSVMYGVGGAEGKCRAVLGVPLRLKSPTVAKEARPDPNWRVIGVLKLENPKLGGGRDGLFTQADASHVKAYAAVVAVALEKAQMRQDSVRIANGLMGVSANLLASLGEEPDLRDIVKETAQVISAQACALWLRRGMELCLAASHGYPVENAAPPPYRLDGKSEEEQPAPGLTVHVATTKKLLNLRSMDEVRNHPAWTGANDTKMWAVEEKGTACYSLLAIPLVDEETGQVRGVFKIENKRPTIFQLESFFNIEDEHLLEALGNSINSSLAIAERFVQLKKLEGVAGQLCYPDGEDAALFLLLTALTHGDGLGYNRALAFMTGSELDYPTSLTCKFAVGRLTMEQWDRAVRQTSESLNLRQLLSDFQVDASPFVETEIMRAWRGRSVSMDDAECQKMAHHAWRETGSLKYQSGDLHAEDVFNQFALGDFALIPLREGKRLRGIIYCDNRFTGNTISKFNLQILDVFAGIAGAVLDAAAVPGRLRAKAEEAWRLFSQPAAHRLGTETNIIDGTVVYTCQPALKALSTGQQDVLRAQEAERRLLGGLEIIRQSARRLRDAAKDYRQLTPDPEWPDNFDLRQLVSESVQKVSLDGLVATVEAEIRPYEVRGRKRRIGYVFEELLLNAWKESPAAKQQTGAPIRVTIRLREESGCVEVLFADNGPGIAKGLVPELFKTPQTGRHGGTGLGLVISRRSLEDEGGTIEICFEGKPEAMPGACFRIRLPKQGDSSGGGAS